MSFNTNLYPTSRNSQTLTNTFTPAKIDVSAQPIGNYGGRLTIQVVDSFNSATSQFDISGGYGYDNQPLKNFYLFDNSISGFSLSATTTVNKPNYLQFQDSTSLLVYTFVFSPTMLTPHTVFRQNPSSVGTGNVTINVTSQLISYFQA